MPNGSDALNEQHNAVRQRAILLAGGGRDLSQRAIVYHHLYRHSHGNHVFPLLAAHGALWGKGHFALGRGIGQIASLADVARPERRAERLAALEKFADAFRDINRRVCVEVFVSYEFSNRFGETSRAADFIDASLLEELNRCHHARRSGHPLDRAGRLRLFETFFRWEQRIVVEPAIDAAMATFDWPFIRRLALRPRIRFSYMTMADTLVFDDFAATRERITHGLAACNIAERVGLDVVEAKLGSYGVIRDFPPASTEAMFTALVRQFGLASSIATAAAI